MNAFKFTILTISLSVPLLSQNINPDSLQKSSKRTKLGFIPVLAFDEDIGVKYGAIVNIFDHGKPNIYPNYKQYAYIKLSNSTKGNTQAILLYESESLIPKTKLIAEISYIKDRLYDFFGFNGTESNFTKAITEETNTNFINRYYYKYDRDFLRMRLDIYSKIRSSKLKCFYGYSFLNYSIGEVKDQSKTNEVICSNSDSCNLYSNYLKWGFISNDESKGGMHHLVNLGLTFDSRNEKTYCTSGTWIDAYFIGAYHANSKSGFLRFNTSIRQYVSIKNKKLTFLYRLNYQSKIAGNTPFYMLSTFYDSRVNQDGLGGAFNLRGIYRNRIIAEGYALGNFELRQKLLSRQIFKTDIDVCAAAFYDATTITKKYEFDKNFAPTYAVNTLSAINGKNLYSTFGSGLIILYNKNNIISLYYGWPLMPQTGKNRGSLYIGSLLLF